MLGIGVASFSHMGGIHFQNQHELEPYFETLGRGELPIHRAMALNEDEKLIREFILQLKFGRVEVDYFQDKFKVDVRQRFVEPLRKHEHDGYLTHENGSILLNRDGLLQVDRLLHEFFRDEHRGARYA